MNQYILHYFNNKNTVADGEHFFQNEVEYILGGELSDRKEKESGNRTESHAVSVEPCTYLCRSGKTKRFTGDVRSYHTWCSSCSYSAGSGRDWA